MKLPLLALSAALFCAGLAGWAVKRVSQLEAHLRAEAAARADEAPEIQTFTPGDGSVLDRLEMLEISAGSHDRQLGHVITSIESISKALSYIRTGWDLDASRQVGSQVGK